MNYKVFYKSWIAWLFICAVIFIIYSGTIGYGILYNYDDDAYFNDARISHLNSANVKEYFTGYYLGMYQPLPVLSFAAVNHVFPGSIPVQRLVQILLHCLNALLVLVLVRKLSGNYWVGTLTALLFAIHPMHVESVTWLATRSNLVYSCFYLLGLILYMTWQDQKRWWQWALMFLCFALSLFSKVTAATFPMVVILIDWFRNKKFTRNVILLYIPLVVLSLIFIWTGVHASGAFGHITELGESYSIADRVAILMEALGLYLVKSVVPVNLSAVYLYPLKVAGSLPVSYYVAGNLALLITLVILVKGWMLRKQDTGRIILFWFLFFLVTISIVMPLKWSRTVLIAERYTYIPYIGIWAMILTLAFRYFAKNPGIMRKIAIGGLSLLLLVFSFLAWNRNRIWKDPVTLFTDVIRKDRSAAEVSLAYYNRGNEYLRLKQPESAIRDYTQAVNYNSDYSDAYYNRGLTYLKSHKIQEAIDDFSTTISLKGDSPDARINRANAYRAGGEYSKALDDLNYVVAIHHDKLAYFNRGVLFYFNLGDPEQACADWEQALRLGFQPAEGILEKYCR